MVKTKELIICIISIIALVLAITTNVFATSDLETLLGNNATNTTNSENEFIEIPSTTTPNNTIANNVVTNNTTNTNVNNNTTNSMPYTGVSYSSLTVIAIAGISAIYAYKKIKEYNV